MTGLTDAELDRYARDYYLGRSANDLGLEERQQELSLTQLRPHLRGRVLELGFGSGRMTATLLAAGIDAALVEGSPLLVEEARRRHPALEVHLAMFERFTPPEPVDCLLAAHVFEHVDDPVGLMGHLRTWLRPGGTLIGVVPNAESLHRRLAVRMALQPQLDSLSARDRMVGHQRVYTIARLSEEMASAGFAVTATTGWFLKVVPNSMMLEWPQALVDALVEISPELAPRDLANVAVIAKRTR